jgi:hypothetical protein
VSEPVEEFEVETLNEYMIHYGENLPNHSTSLNGRGKFVKIGMQTPPVFRTKQEAYRFCSYILAMAPLLPDEPGNHTYEEVEAAIKNA